LYNTVFTKTNLIPNTIIDLSHYVIINDTVPVDLGHTQMILFTVTEGWKQNLPVCTQHTQLNHNTKKTILM